MMGAPGTARWIEAQKAARARLRREAVDRALRRIAIGGLVLIVIALLLSPADAAVAPSELHGQSIAIIWLIAELAGMFFGFVAGVCYAAWRMTGQQ